MPDRSVSPRIEVPRQFKLIHARTKHIDSGLALHIIHAGSLPLVKLEFVFRSGSWFESFPGVAFFTSRMLPEGTKRFSSDEISFLFERYGAFLEIHPGPDYCSVVLYVMNRHLEHLTDVLREIIFNPVFPEKELEILRQHQYNNLQISRKKNSFMASTKFLEILFGKEHPYGRTMDEEVINNQDPAKLAEYHRKFFPGNFEIIVSGKVEDKLVALLEQTFSGCGPVHLKPFDKKALKQNVERVHLKKKDSYQSALRIGHLSIKKNHPDFIRVMVMNELFGGYFGSRLMQNIREDKGYTYGIYSSLVSYHESGYFVISADVKKEFAEKAIEEIYKEIDLLRTEKVSEAELDKVKNYLKGNYLSSITTAFSIAEKFRNVHFYGLDYSFYDELFERIDKINTEDILIAARQYLNPDKMSEVLVG